MSADLIRVDLVEEVSRLRSRINEVEAGTYRRELAMIVGILGVSLLVYVNCQGVTAPAPRPEVIIREVEVPTPPPPQAREREEEKPVFYSGEMAQPGAMGQPTRLVACETEKPFDKRTGIELAKSYYRLLTHARLTWGANDAQITDAVVDCVTRCRKVSRDVNPREIIELFVHLDAISPGPRKARSIKKDLEDYVAYRVAGRSHSQILSYFILDQDLSNRSTGAK